MDAKSSVYIWNQGEEDWVQEHYLVIVVKREESKVFGVVWMCLGEKLDIIEQEKARKSYIYKRGVDCN